MSHRFLLAAASAAAALALSATAAAGEVQTTITGWTHAPGPRKYDRLDVTKFGSASAKTVLVLVPGTNGGRGDFTRLIGEDTLISNPLRLLGEEMRLAGTVNHLIDLVGTLRHG